MAGDPTPGTDHNGGVQQLNAYVQRLERLRSEIDDLQDDYKEVMKEAASAGWDKAMLQEMLRLRRKFTNEQLELFEETRTTYMAALNMLPKFEKAEADADVPDDADDAEPQGEQADLEDYIAIEAPRLQIEGPQSGDVEDADYTEDDPPDEEPDIPENLDRRPKK